MQNKGFIQLDRSPFLQLFSSKVFDTATEFLVWLFLLTIAEYQDGANDIRKGQVKICTDHIAIYMGISVATTIRILNSLEKKKLISKYRNSKYLTITIKDYNKYTKTTSKTKVETKTQDYFEQ